MKKPAYFLILVILFTLLSTSPLAAGAASGRQAGPQLPMSVDASFIGDEITIAELSGGEYSPAVAYNSVHDQYLVVWENMWPGGHHDIYAQRISGSGQLLSWFAVASLPNKQMNPSVGYDPVRDRYLVVWAYDYNGNDSDWDVYGRFIPWNGSDASLTDFSICDWTSNQRRPVVAFGLAQDEFLVTWTNAPSGQPTYISARRVFADGSGFPFGGFPVSSGAENRDFQDVAYNLARNEYLVTWDVDKSGSGLDIYGVRLSATGGALTGGDPSVTGEFPIAGWSADEERPSVAACSAGDQYLVAWQSDQDTGGSDYAIYARYLNGEAVPGAIPLIADTTSPQKEAEVACDSLGKRYLLAWQDQYVGSEYGIWARLAYPDGSQGPEFELVGPRSAADRQFPALGGGRSTFFAAWEHDRDGGANIDIHGRLLRYAVYLPMTAK